MDDTRLRMESDRKKERAKERERERGRAREREREIEGEGEKAVRSFGYLQPALLSSTHQQSSTCTEMLMNKRLLFQYLEMRLKSVYPKYMCCISSVLFSVSISNTVFSKYS